MNPLNHFGIQKQFIRGDTKSYNKTGAPFPIMTMGKCKFCNNKELYEYPNGSKDCPRCHRTQ